MNWAFLKDDARRFFGEVEQFLGELGIEHLVKNLESDHMGVRCENPDTVAQLSSEIQSEGTLLSSSIVNGREIQILELASPLTLGTRSVHCVELPYPKQNHAYTDGWEHIEFVIPSSARTLSEFRSEFIQTFPRIDMPHLAALGIYSESLPQAGDDQRPNPTIELTKSKNLTVKFHPASIKEIVVKT